MAAQQPIPVFTGELIKEAAQYCNARDLHAALQIDTRFNDWITRRVDEYGFVEGEDFYSSLSKTSGSAKGGRPTIDYHLTLDMAKELAMIENNDIGRAVRRYFIQAENELRQRIIADLEDRARHTLTLPGIKSIRGSISFKQTVVLQKQSRDLIQLILNEPAAPAQLNLHRQLRQVNDALGIPTDPLEEIVSGMPALDGHPRPAANA